jgi:hypothetical protein
LEEYRAGDEGFMDAQLILPPLTTEPNRLTVLTYSPSPLEPSPGEFVDGIDPEEKKLYEFSPPSARPEDRRRY